MNVCVLNSMSASQFSFNLNSVYLSFGVLFFFSIVWVFFFFFFFILFVCACVSHSLTHSLSRYIVFRCVVNYYYKHKLVLRLLLRLLLLFGIQIVGVSAIVSLPCIRYRKYHTKCTFIVCTTRRTRISCVEFHIRAYVWVVWCECEWVTKRENYDEGVHFFSKWFVYSRRQCTSTLDLSKNFIFFYFLYENEFTWCAYARTSSFAYKVAIQNISVQCAVYMCICTRLCAFVLCT